VIVQEGKIFRASPQDLPENLDIYSLLFPHQYGSLI
jgi:hypothetical protein